MKTSEVVKSYPHINQLKCAPLYILAYLFFAYPVTSYHDITVKCRHEWSRLLVHPFCYHHFLILHNNTYNLFNFASFTILGTFLFTSNIPPKLMPFFFRRQKSDKFQQLSTHYVQLQPHSDSPTLNYHTCL